MESIKDINEIDNLKENSVYGNFELINSEIRFLGSNNILFCDDNIKLVNSAIFFRGDNSIVYLSYTRYGNYIVAINVRSNSTIYVGKDMAMGSNFQINVSEHQNLIIGDDALIENNIYIRTSEEFPIYDIDKKERANHSGSVFIGDHVWIDHFAHIEGGVKIGSGAIVATKTFVPPNYIVKSNSRVMGNPAITIEEDIFFTKEFTGSYNAEDTLNFSTYKSDVFCYKYAEDETLSIDSIDETLKDLTVNDKIEFIQKVFVKNKRRNRFSI